MSIPKYNEFYRDVLDVLKDEKEHSLKEIRAVIAKKRNFTQYELNEMMSSGKQTIYSNRVAWAVTYLNAAGLLTHPKRGFSKLTEEGKRIQGDSSLVLDNAFMMRYPSFAEFIFPTKNPAKKVTGNTQAKATAPIQPAPQPKEDSDPQEAIDTAYHQLKAALAQQLLEEVLSRDSDFFEHLVVKLLRNMNYGGPFEDAFQVTQRSNDGGIDGIIKEDPLGFSKIYIQAKRWDPSITISRPEIQKFCGALQDTGAHKGLFITTARFSSSAEEYASRQHIVLVDGVLLTRLMIEYDLGVSTTQTYSIKEVDHDFFDED